MWTPFNFFVGVWKGVGQGQPGRSRVERTCEIVLNGKFLFVRNKSIYEPQENNSEGEIHEDWGLISYDHERETYVFRQFHVEGFVNRYLLEEIAEDSQTIRFVTEAIEKISPGWQARESYRMLSPDEFSEVFELAAPDKGFKVYTENHFHRIRQE